MTRPRLLDLFCGAGGAAMGYHRAGFEVVGIDIKPQPHYPFRFLRCDAVGMVESIAARQTRGEESFFLGRIDAVHASPPCQWATAYGRRPGHVGEYPNLIPIIRAELEVSGLPYVIENVEGARKSLRDPIMLCGSSFGLDVRRHRLFESNVEIPAPACAHGWQTPRFPPATNRTNLRSTVEVGVWRIPLDVQSRAMGIDWMILDELSEAIPPAYTEHIGGWLIDAIWDDVQDRRAWAAGRWDA